MVVTKPTALPGPIRTPAPSPTSSPPGRSAWVWGDPPGDESSPDAVGRRHVQRALAMVAEFEFDVIRLRTSEGMKVAKAKGRLRSKQPKLNRHQEAHLVSLVHSGE